MREEVEELLKQLPWWMRRKKRLTLKEAERIVLLAFLAAPAAILPFAFLFPGLRTVLIPAAVVSYTLPCGLLLDRMEKFRESVERNFVYFLRSLAENIKSGMSLVESLELASEGNYGQLTPLIRYSVYLISWGKNMFEVLDDLAERVSSTHIKRTITNLKAGVYSGGDFSDVLLSSSRDLEESIDMREKLKTRSTSHSMIGFMSFFVYIFTVLVILLYFFPQITGAHSSSFFLFHHGGHHAGNSTNSTKAAKIAVSESMRELKWVLYWGSMVQAGGIGALSGLLSKGRLSSCLLFVSILTLMTVAIFFATGIVRSPWGALHEGTLFKVGRRSSRRRCCPRR